MPSIQCPGQVVEDSIQHRVTQEPDVSLEGILRGCLECGIVLVEPGGQIGLLNDAAAELLGIHPSLPAPMALLPDPLQSMIREARDKRYSLAKREVVLSTGEGKPHSLNASSLLLPTDKGGESVLLILHGVQLDDPFEAKLRHLERLARIGVMATGLAHDLRNALVALRAFTDVLLEQATDNEFAQTVRHELNRANEIAAHMLKYARPTQPALANVSVHQILDHVLQLAHPRVKETGACVDTSWSAASDTVLGDEAQLEQAFLNLVLNAVDSLDSDREVRLATELMSAAEGSQPAILVSIEDTGTGVSPENLSNLFQPFFTTKRHGTGLGLYLAQRILRDHAGSIAVDSVPGRGTTLQVRLPLCEARA